MAIDIDYDGDLESIISDIGTTINYNSKSYACVVSSATDAIGDLNLAGYYRQQTLQVVIQTKLFASKSARPKAQDTLIYDGETYRITSVETDAADKALNLTCEEITA